MQVYILPRFQEIYVLYMFKKRKVTVLRIYDCVLSNDVTKDGSCTEGDGNGFDIEAELTHRIGRWW